MFEMSKAGLSRKCDELRQVGKQKQHELEMLIWDEMRISGLWMAVVIDGMKGDGKEIKRRVWSARCQELRG